jgi:pimeloyl-ACP methyl ester carboxylesterase
VGPLPGRCWLGRGSLRRLYPGGTGEIFRAPRSWAEQGYPTLTYYHQAAKGGHFAAWEEPQLFSEELRAAFKSLR